jgi:small-conductance mechanosensitive channel
LEELANTLITYIPHVLGALAIVAVGFVLAAVARRGSIVVLRRLGFDRACERVGVTRLMREGGMERTPTQLAALVVFYAIVLVAILAALGPLGLDFLAETLNALILYAPQALAAILIVLLGTSAAGVVSELAGRTLLRVGVRRTGPIESFVRFAIVFVAAVLAAAVLGIDVAILLVITVIALGAVALTASLALGLGLRGLSENVAASRYVSEDINEGDQISVNSFSGTVERVGQTATTLRGENGRLYIIPNGYFLERVVEKEEPPAEGS